MNSAGLTLTATYNSGSTATISGGYTCSPTMLNTAGTQSITVTYAGKTTTFSVKVSDVVLSSISLRSKPTKTSYYVGDTLDTTGLTLTATYSNGGTEIITTGFICTPTTLSSSGTQTISVTYENKSTSFTVSVLETWSDWVTKLPDGIDASAYEIEEKTQYCSAKITSWQTFSDGMMGPCMYCYYDRTEFTTSVGDWSDWLVEGEEGIIGAPGMLPIYYYSQEEEKEYGTQYRYRDQTGSPEAYGDWSEWQFEQVTSTETRQIETRQVYRMRLITTYSTRYYYHIEGNIWLEIYSDTPVTPDENTAVRTRVLYRYRKRS